MEYTGAIVAGDWDKTGFHATRDGKKVQLIPDTVESITAFVGAGNTFVIEKTSWSYPRDRRAEMVASLEAANIDIRGIDPRMTDKRRRTYGVDKSNDNDARTIWRYANEQPAKVFEAYPAGETALMEALKDRRVDIQKSGFAKSPEWRAFRKLIPKEFKGYTCKGIVTKALSDALLIGLTLLATNTGSRAEFESYLGSYGEGKRSIFRAQYERFGIRKGTSPQARSAFRKRVRQYRSWVLQPGLRVPESLSGLRLPG